MNLSKLRDNSLFKGLAVFVAINVLAQIVFPSVAFALTSGPSQPEVQSFEPVGTTEMVDLFTGDFTYNIPLFELPGPNGGYPFNMAYHSGIGMDQEASWVGLGWNLNPGTINRSMRGLPDDFNGDVVKKTIDMKDNITYGVGVGAQTEIFGSDAFVSLGGQVRIYYNNYRGVGYTLAPSISLGKSSQTVQGGLGFSLDSQEGVGANASVSLNASLKGTKSNLNFGVGFNSRRGLDLSLTGGVSESNEDGSVTNDRKNKQSRIDGSKTSSMGGGSSYSFSEKAFTPFGSLPMRNRFIDVRIKTGAGLSGTFASYTFSGFFSTQYLKNAGETFTQRAYGYNYLENATNDDLMDFNRSKDGAIRKETPNLAIPNLTYDYYNVTGQGTGGMYRPYRSDIGVLHDPFVESNTFGGALAGDAGPKDHIGVAATITSGNSSTGVWDNNGSDPNNQLADFYAFRGFYESDGVTMTDQEDYETVYYKMHGEMTSFGFNEMDFIGGEDPVRAALKSSGKIKPTENFLVKKNGTKIHPSSGGGPLEGFRKSSDRGRMPRNTSVQPITNDQMGGNNPVIGEYDVNYYSSIQSGSAPYQAAPGNSIERTERGDFSKSIDDHIGGVTSVNTDGARYVYGLPAYNLSDETYNFSTEDPSCAATIDIPNDGTDINYKVANTNEYFDKTELPAYAYSYLLTSVLGSDYVDSDAIPGPSDDDMGYWVKFNYVKTNDDYQWRAPFLDANYNKGLNSAQKDNTASFKYGKKEVYHVATVETKTHIAVYHLSPRSDAKGAYELLNGSISGNNVMGANSYKLDKISLYVKNEYKTNGANAIPIKEVHFTYNYELCQGTLNSTAGGKLTLKKVHFTYQKNKRGELNPYEFNYGVNRGYSLVNYDRWGNYKAPLGSSDYCDDLNYPYVDQFDETGAIPNSVFQVHRDLDASSWNITRIGLPTGGAITVKYEADDYGYVQHKVAQQMFKIDHLGEFGTGQIYSGGNQDPSDRRIYFKLENPVSTAQEFHDQYLKDMIVDGKYQLYYKIKVNLRDDLWEYISGYANIVPNGWGISGSTMGWVELEKTDINGPINFHPFAVAAWQHMRTVQPDLLTTVGTASSSEISAVKSLASIFPEIVKVFKGYRDFSADNGYATDLDPAFSYIRLCSPDKKKYGGGQRVKQITISDEWNTMSGEEKSTYGQVYDYTIQEDGKTISSGVAQYEPMIGGDENALRYAKNYPQSIPTMTDNNLFFEFPINESYYPAAIVGYRKVTVRSIATRDVMNGTLPAAVPTTGITESEFYTAKDYPVITDETDNQKSPYNLYIPIPLIGQINVNNLTASQGYSITLNDMHGKPKSVKSFAIDKNGNKVLAPITTVESFYKDRVKSYQNKTVKELVNTVTVLLDEFDPASGMGSPIRYKALTELRKMGVEYEFFTDMRRNLSETEMGGAQINTDMVGVTPYAIPAFVPWPTVNVLSSNLSTVVTNKIIHKAGILEKTVVTDGQSTVITKNLLHDVQTGRVLLSSVNNDFDEPVYEYDIPAHWKHEGMGAAYKNYGINFSGDVSPDIFTTDVLDVTFMNNEASFLVPGDEFVITYNNGNDKTRAIYLGESSCFAGSYLFYSPVAITENGVDFLHYRSGRRNQLVNDASSIVALQNPTQNIERINLPTLVEDNPQCDIGFNTVQVPATRCISLTGATAATAAASNQITDAVAGFLNFHAFPTQPFSIGKNTIHSFNKNSSVQGACINECQTLTTLLGNSWVITLEYDFDDRTFFPDDHTIIVRLSGGDCSNQNCWFFPWTHHDIVAMNFYTQPGALGSNLMTLQFREDNAWHGTIRILTTNNGCGGLFGNNFAPYNAIEHFTIPTQVPFADITTVQDNVTVFDYQIDKVLQISAVEMSEKISKIDPQLNLMTNGSEVAPYVYIDGSKGVWRIKKAHNYFDDRITAYDYAPASTTEVDLSEDGVTNNVSLFNFEHPVFFEQNVSAWKVTNEITKYNDTGYEIENKEILGIYSSAKYGYGNTLPVIVASNARVNDIYFESYEEGSNSIIESHTGKKSAAINTTTNVVATDFVPSSGEYIVSAWVKWPNSPKGFTYKESIPWGINIAGTIIEPVGEVIEGWQKMEGKVTLLAHTTDLIYDLIPPSGQTVYFDDIRIFPIDANVNTHVYDPTTFRLSATLDENNYSFFYFYDEGGDLFLVKKETVRGIKTIQESRKHLSLKGAAGTGTGTGGGSQTGTE